MNDASCVWSLWYDMQVYHVMQVCYVMICKFIMLCKFAMLWYASSSCHVMQVYHVMLCKYAMLWYASMLCKFGMIILFMLSCYASLSWVYEHKASSFMLKVAFWQHVSYHISYDNLHVRLNANLWPFLHVIYHHVSPIC